MPDVAEKLERMLADPNEFHPPKDVAVLVREFVSVEREANAKIADRYSDEEGYDASTSRAIAAAIRART